MPEPVECTNCDGTGVIVLDAGLLDDCPQCDGSGIAQMPPWVDEPQDKGD